MLVVATHAGGVRAADPATLAQTGSAACAICHGDRGQGLGDFPRLAGLQAGYLARQLEDYAAGRRDNPVMTPLAKALAPADRAAVANYYARLPAPVAATPAPATAPGGWLATRGAWTKGVPACVQCHGPRGSGVGAVFPSIAGQPAGYIAAQLKAFASGARRNDPQALMRTPASKLSEDEIDQVARWFAGSLPAVAGAAAATRAPTATTAASRTASSAFQPPDEANIPDDVFGALVRRGRDLFVDTPRLAPKYVGNGLSCSNCHLDSGRLASSAPLWGAWVRYPAYRAKTRSVSSYAERLQGCFSYSMNGKPPPLGSPELAALEAYSFWMAKDAPTGTSLPGAGYPRLKKAPAAADYTRGERVYAANCAICHGVDGAGQKVGGSYVFPPLWGPDSYNWGAGMHQLDNAAAFIRANMPLGRGGTLTEQEAWDVAAFTNGHERPQDPRFTGDVASTRQRFHDDPNSPYGTVVNGHLLGSGAGRR